MLLNRFKPSHLKFKYPSELSQTSGTLQHQFPSRENKTLSVQKSNSNTVYLYINGVSSNPVEGYKTDRHDITEILLKVTLNAIALLGGRTKNKSNANTIYFICILL